MTRELNLENFVDADFCGLHSIEPSNEVASAQSRTGYIIKLGGFPLIWKSQLQSAVATSTMMAEYHALSSSLRAMIPIRELLVELADRMALPAELQTSIRANVHEDNNGALLLTTNQRITARTRHYNVNWHFFWQYVKDKVVNIVKVASELQDADFLTKVLPRPSFEANRKRVMGW